MFCSIIQKIDSDTISCSQKCRIVFFITFIMLPKVFNKVLALPRNVHNAEDSLSIVKRTFASVPAILSNHDRSSSMEKELENALLKSCQVIGQNQINFIHTSMQIKGRYGHRLIKLWEQKEYTTDPLKVYRTGGRLPVENWKGTGIVLKLKSLICHLILFRIFQTVS